MDVGEFGTIITLFQMAVKEERRLLRIKTVYNPRLPFVVIIPSRVSSRQGTFKSQFALSKMALNRLYLVGSDERADGVTVLFSPLTDLHLFEMY